MANYICTVFFHARATREVHVQFPKEAVNFGEGNVCGKQKYSMYGTRDVAPAKAPGTKEEGKTSEDHKVELGDEEATLCRALGTLQLFGWQTRYFIYCEGICAGDVETNTRGYVTNGKNGNVFRRNAKVSDAPPVVANTNNHDHIQGCRSGWLPRQAYVYHRWGALNWENIVLRGGARPNH